MHLKIVALLFFIFLNISMEAKKNFGATFSFSNDGLESSLSILPGLVYETEYFLGSFGFGFQSNEIKTNSADLEKNSFNPLFIDLAFKLNLNKKTDLLYGSRLIFNSGKYKNNTYDSNTKIALTGGLLYALEENIKLSFMLDFYTTIVREWTPQGGSQEEILASGFLSGGKFGLIYKF